MNLCPTCRQDFGSVRAFDAHRLGKHDYLYSDKQPDGRRCMSITEIRVQGFAKNAAGRWSLAQTLEAARVVRESKAAPSKGISAADPEAACAVLTPPQTLSIPTNGDSIVLVLERDNREEAS
jgi:hypothetical protein